MQTTNHHASAPIIHRSLGETLLLIGITAAVVAGCGTQQPSASSPPAATMTATAISDADIADAYLYLLGRQLVLRQEHLDFGDGGFKWNSESLPAGTQRIDLPSKKSRSLMRVELGSTPQQAQVLQRQIKLYPTGTPTIASPVAIPLFTNDKLPGGEIFDTARAVLDSEPDINPGMDGIRRKVDASIALSKTDRPRVQKAVETIAWPKFKASFSKMGTTKNGWNRPSTIGKYGDDWMTRTLINFAGIWANSNEEAVYFKTDSDGTGTKLDGAKVYAMVFPADGLPASHVKYFWSVIAVDSTAFRVIPNARNRFLLNNQSKLQYGKDGSLTLYLAPTKPAGVLDGNWLPTPKGQNYNLTWRSYGPDAPTVSGAWFPAPIKAQ